jgi:TonB family protein
VALLLSILLHQVFLTGLSTVFDFSKPEPEKRHEVVLLKEPPKEKAKKQAVAKKPKKQPKKRQSPVRRPLPPKPMPQAPAPSIEEPVVAEAPSPETEGPIATSPEPEPRAKPTPPKLDLSWKSFEKMFGAKAVEDREAYAQKSLEKRRGSRAFGSYSARVRRALNNNKSFIKPGQQEVLGNRQQLFHNYIEAIHETSIHPLFADSFLRSLPSLSPSDPLNDWSLNMVAEFEIFENGTISEIRVVRTSGNHVFDAGAVDAIYRSSPFPPPPKQVLSWNRRVYLRWGFYRNNRKCGVFNVEPYILKAPGAKEAPLPVDKFTIQDG